MKRNHSHSLIRTINSRNLPEQKPTAQPEEKKSPYLRAILSGAPNPLTFDNELPELNADRLAAIRYIKESAIVKKMSC
ncbi:MAG: hypothetical protein ACRDEB_06435 [Chitinophagaceae bacterium]